MSNSLITQTFEGLNVRVVVREGEPWFIAKDLAEALGYSQTNKMTQLIDDEDKHNETLQNGGNYANQTLINESGLYAAIFGSTKENAKRFKRWVTQTVLPELRKNGGYTVGQEALSPELQALQQEAHRIASRANGLYLTLVKSMFIKAGDQIELMEAIKEAAKVAEVLKENEARALSRAAQAIAGRGLMEYCRKNVAIGSMVADTKVTISLDDLLSNNRFKKRWA